MNGGCSANARPKPAIPLWIIPHRHSGALRQAQDGIQNPGLTRSLRYGGVWIPAFAGMTVGYGNGGGGIRASSGCGVGAIYQSLILRKGAFSLAARTAVLIHSPYKAARRRPSPSGRGLGEGETPGAANLAGNRQPCPKPPTRPTPPFPRKRESTAPACHSPGAHRGAGFRPAPE